jgi:hypothetical protein
MLVFFQALGMAKQRFSMQCVLCINRPCQGDLMMEAARTSETSIDIQLRTRQYIPEDSELHTMTWSTIAENLRNNGISPRVKEM